jgi:hypothetical protein
MDWRAVIGGEKTAALTWAGAAALDVLISARIGSSDRAVRTDLQRLALLARPKTSTPFLEDHLLTRENTENEKADSCE